MNHITADHAENLLLKACKQYDECETKDPIALAEIAKGYALLAIAQELGRIREHLDERASMQDAR